MQTSPRHITVTYEIVTPESAAEGDAEDRGFEEGERITPDEFDIADHQGDESAAAVRLAVDFIASNGGVEPSNWPRWHEGTWYTQIDPDRDYETGSETRYSYHLECFDESEEPVEAPSKINPAGI